MERIQKQYILKDLNKKLVFLIGPRQVGKTWLAQGIAEPFLADNSIESDRWRMQYVNGLIRTDVLDFERIHDFKAIELVLELLRLRVGLPVHINPLPGMWVYLPIQ